MHWKKFAALSSSALAGLGALGGVLLLLATSTSAFADPNNLFVTTGGSGSACTQAAPCALPTAMGQAVDRDALYLGAGNYTSSGPAVITVTESITIFGGWDGAATDPPVRDPAAYPTILDGEGQRRVVYISNLLTPILDGLTITGGDSTNAPYPGLGGGIYSSDSNPTIRNSLIQDNIATSDGRGFGGGIYIAGGSNALVENNRILSNTAAITGDLGSGGGISLHWAPGAIITGNQIRLNVAQAGTADRYGSEGGGLFCRSSVDVTIENNDFRDNIASVLASGGGGGVGVQGCDRLRVTRNIFQGNYGATPPTGHYGRGGGLWVYASLAVTIDANRFLSNTANQGGGLYILRNTTFTMTNNIVAENFAGYQGGGVTFETDASEPVTGTLVHNTFAANNRGVGEGRIAVHLNSIYLTLVLTNNLIYSHTYGVYAIQNSSADLYNTLFYALSEGDTGGMGAITNTAPVTGQNPLLDIAYHLLATSPAVDAGAVIPWVTTDIDGDLRPFREGYDIGADESTDIEEHLYYLPLIRQ